MYVTHTLLAATTQNKLQPHVLLYSTLYSENKLETVGKNGLFSSKEIFFY